MAWAESDFPTPTMHEPVMFPASRDPLGASCLGSDSQEQSASAESESNEYGEHRHRPSLAKVVLSLNSNYERQQALSHILSALQIIYSRDAVVRALMNPHSFIRGESKPTNTEDDEVASLTSVSEVSIDDVALTEVASGSRKSLIEGVDEFTSSLGHDDSRLLVELLKLAVADRAGENGREVLSDTARKNGFALSLIRIKGVVKCNNGFDTTFDVHQIISQICDAFTYTFDSNQR